MALIRLLQPKSSLHLQRVGLVNPTRFSTSTSNDAAENSSQSRKRSPAKEQRTAAVESFVKKYMETNPGIFPKVTHVRNNVGGSWNILKGVLTDLKEKMMGTPKFQNPTSNITSDSKVVETALAVVTTHSSKYVSEHGEAKSVTSHIISENYSDDMVRSDNTSDRLKLLESENGHLKLASAVSDVKHFNGDQKLKFGATRTLQVTSRKWPSNGHRNHQPQTEMMTSSPTPNAGSEVGGTPPVSFCRDLKIKGLAEFFKRKNSPAAEAMIGENDGSVPPNTPEYLNETTGRDVVKGSSILGLIDCIKELPREQSTIRSDDNIVSNKINQPSNKVSIKGMQPMVNVQRSNNKGRKTSLNGQNMGMGINNTKESEDDRCARAPSKVFCTNFKSKKEESDIDVAAFDQIKSKPDRRVPLPTIKEDLNNTMDAFFTEKGSNKNKVIVRFLHKSVGKGDIDFLFKDCGCIANIEFHAKRSFFKIACIYFKTNEGMKKALTKTGAVIYNTFVIVEAACSTENMPNKTSIPNLIGDPDVPSSLVKNPTRTVMIKQLTPDISSHDVEEALTFCGSNISGFFFGSSNSIAYVEFETEGAKEKALEKHSINVLGKQLLIFRIDVPRTTVVRISNLFYNKSLQYICETYGRVKFLVPRSNKKVDVHYDLTEWPNMLQILNGLNGLQVDGSQLIAQPAPVFPPPVLRVLWNHPDERRRLKTLIHSLLQKLEEYPTPPKDGLTSTINEYYRMDDE